MNISAICGSSNVDSSNLKALQAIDRMFPSMNFQFPSILELPLFRVAIDTQPYSQEVLTFRKEIEASDAILICTPEYLHNIPAVLKNALEWLTTTGEMCNKRVLPMTFTPHTPRGEKAMLSLTNSLKALDANVVTSMSMYHSDVNREAYTFSDDMIALLQEAMKLLRY